MQKAIVTSYCFPTNTRGACMKARHFNEGASMKRPYDHALSAEANHRELAEAFAAELKRIEGVAYEVIHGAHFGDDYVWVLV